MVNMAGEQRKSGSAVLAVLAGAQFLMVLDTSVMNVNIADVAKDINSTVTGIQGAITAFALVMAALMLTGGTLGLRWGRKPAFRVGLVIYGLGSLMTSLSQSLPTLMFGWSLFEGAGSALILPAIVALVAANFEPAKRPATYGAIAAAGAIGVAVGPLIGGAVATLFSWRLVFLSESIIVVVLLFLLRTVHDSPPGPKQPFDVVGALGSVVGLGVTVMAILRSAEWGWVQPRADAPSVFGVAATIPLILSGLLLIAALLAYENRRERSGRTALISMELLRIEQLRSSLTVFSFQFAVQSGVFFVVPLFLTVVIGLSPFATGVRLFPLSVALLLTAALVPRLLPKASPRRVVTVGISCMALAAALLVTFILPTAAAGVVLIPMALMGLGIGLISTQLGAVTVSSAPDDRSSEVGGLQNTATNLGYSIGTAIAGSVLIVVLTSASLLAVNENTKLSNQAKQAAQVQLAKGAPFISDAQLEAGFQKAGIPRAEAQATVEGYSAGRIRALRWALLSVLIMSLGGLVVARKLPTTPAAELAAGATVP